MLDFIGEYWVSLLIVAALFALCTAVLIFMKKHKKSCCTGDCLSCGGCKTKTKKEDLK